jgi:hypothetical protein
VATCLVSRWVEQRDGASHVLVFGVGVVPTRPTHAAYGLCPWSRRDRSGANRDVGVGSIYLWVSFSEGRDDIAPPVTNKARGRWHSLYKACFPFLGSLGGQPRSWLITRRRFWKWGFVVLALCW